ncbi:MAG: carbohydrate kinase family protein [Verrucomicrobiota bacterium]
MSSAENVDILILNTAVLDIRSSAFDFVDRLVGPGGLAKCDTADMPDYSQEQLRQLIREGRATAGGPGNTAPLLAKTGLEVAVGANLGGGDYGGLDVQGRMFYDILADSGVDLSPVKVHPTLPTGTTFIYDAVAKDRGGIAYFPNANNDFDFADFKPYVERVKPDVVYYMYSGLSDRGDANGGRDLAEFIRWCRELGCITIVDSHTLVADPRASIESGAPVEAYHLLEPLLPELDIFFTSGDEAKMIVNTLEGPRKWSEFNEEDNLKYFLQFLVNNFTRHRDHARLFGVTRSKGAMACYIRQDDSVLGPEMFYSDFMDLKVVDLVGAGDSFRAGMLSYVARHAEAFKAGEINVEEAIQMGNLTASLYINAPLEDRYSKIKSFEKMLAKLQGKEGLDD